MNHNKFSKEEWASIVRGLRKHHNWSRSDLAKELGCHICTPLRWENSRKIPRERSINKVLGLIKKSGLKVEELNEFRSGFSKDMTKPKLDLEFSEELAELIGIIIGDGEIHKDGTIRIAFDTKKDKNFLHRRVFRFVQNLLNKNISFESHGRIAFYSIAFKRFLEEDCGLKHGSKFRNNVSIPTWCFSRKDWMAAVLRGLFDTDGYFGYDNGSLEVMFGRFSDKCTNLVGGIEQAMLQLGLCPRITHHKDGRLVVQLTSKDQVLSFFNQVGTSNVKHIVRFLLWRIKKYPAKIEKEGLENLLSNLKESFSKDLKSITLPFLWNHEQTKTLLPYILLDFEYLDGIKLQKAYKWSDVTSQLIDRFGTKVIAERLGIGQRSVRRWRDGTRFPSPQFRTKLIQWQRTQ